VQIENGERSMPISRSVLIRFWAGSAITGLLMGEALFISAGTLQWLHGWLLLAVLVGGALVTSAWLSRVNPDVFVALTRRPGEGTKVWDRVMQWVLPLSFFGVLIVASLDDGRFHWTPAPPWAVLAGYVLLLAGTFGVGWAQAVNRHYDPIRRIQPDRDHHVVTAGPYASVRHPEYIFGTAQTFGVALALGSWWALLPAAWVAALLAVRTFVEDATLKRELPGYATFATQVRYKWIPGVW
jgi:protein-S-isoprenylcysteine O-methyltransferase Ste14